MLQVQIGLATNKDSWLQDLATTYRLTDGFVPSISDKIYLGARFRLVHSDTYVYTPAYFWRTATIDCHLFLAPVTHGILTLPRNVNIMKVGTFKRMQVGAFTGQK